MPFLNFICNNFQDDTNNCNKGCNEKEEFEQFLLDIQQYLFVSDAKRKNSSLGTMEKNINEKGQQIDQYHKTILKFIYLKYRYRMGIKYESTIIVLSVLGYYFNSQLFPSSVMICMVAFSCSLIYIVSNNFDCLSCFVRYSEVKDVNIDNHIKGEPNLKIYNHERIERLDTGGNRLNPGDCVKERVNGKEDAILGCHEIVKDFRFLHNSERNHLAKATVGVGEVNSSESKSTSLVSEHLNENLPFEKIRPGTVMKMLFHQIEHSRDPHSYHDSPLILDSTYSRYVLFHI